MFRHNYATWMRQYAGLDALGLTRTGAWSDMAVGRTLDSLSLPFAGARRANAVLLSADNPQNERDGRGPHR